MTATNPLSTTLGDLITQALKDSHAIGDGQTPSATDMTDGWIRLQWMMQQWQVQRFLVYHLNTWVVTATGQITPYTIGPGGQIDLSLPGVTVSRPNRIESAFFQQIITPGNYGPIRYKLTMLPSMEDYNKLALPNLQTFSLIGFYDPAFARTGGLGRLFVYPWPNASIYAIGVTIREQLPAAWPSLATLISLPFEYYGAMVSNLAMALRPKYGIIPPPGDELPRLARDGLRILRGANTAITNLSIPPGLTRPGIYNIFSDQTY